MKRLHTYSQHFLRSPKLVRDLINLTSIKRTDTVYDIGAGSGIISSVLARHCQQVIAVEAEPGALKLLEKNLASYKNITIKRGDFLDMTLPSEPYKVFSNIPFHISSDIVQKLVSSPNPPAAAYLIVQKQFAGRLLSDRPGSSSQLGMMIGPSFSTKVIRNLKRTDFLPNPNVDTVLLEIKQRDKPLLPESSLASYKKLIEKSFNSPGYFATLPLNIVSREASVKPSDLTLTQWLVLLQAATRK